jgi:hypothetical protein
MVVHDLYVLRAGGRPAEAHADTVLPCAVAPERFQPVARRYAEVIYPARDLQLPQLASCYRFIEIVFGYQTFLGSPDGTAIAVSTSSFRDSRFHVIYSVWKI